MRVRSVGKREEKIELQMTPMIDIVFQLLVFFIMTFKVVVQEGDFNIKMPLAAPREGLPDDNLVPPLKVTLTAGSNGRISRITLGDKNFGVDFQQLHGYIAEFIGEDRGPGSIQETAEVEFQPDYNLRYEELVRAVTSVSGYVNREGNVIKLVEKIKFAPPNSGG